MEFLDSWSSYVSGGKALPLSGSRMEVQMTEIIGMQLHY